MESIYSFIKSDVGVLIAWLCTVGSVIYALIKGRENKSLKMKIESIEQNNTTDNGSDSIIQSGDKNVYTKHNSGGMNIKM